MATMKARVIDVAKDVWRSNVVVVANFAGGNTADIQQLRAAVGEHHVRVKFLKNSLANAALQEFPERQPLGNLLSCQTLFLFSDDNPVAALKAAQNLEAENKVTLLGAACGSVVLTRSGVQAAAKLPELSTLRVDLLGAMLGPSHILASTLKQAHNAQGLVSAMESPARKAAQTLAATEQKLLGSLLSRQAQLGQ